MTSPNELTRVLYELAIDIGNGTDLAPMLKQSLRTLLRKLSGFGAVVLADRYDGTKDWLEDVYALPGNLMRNGDIKVMVDHLCAGDTMGLPPTDWSAPLAVPCSDFFIYRLDLPEYGTLLMFKSSPLDPIIARSLKQICGKLANACIACENAAALAESRERLHVTFESIGDAVIVTDKDGRITRMNPIAERLTGWSCIDARNRPLTEVFNIICGETREPAKNPVERVIASGEIVGLANHTVLISKAGGECQIADSGAPIRDRDGAIIGVVLVFRDMTEEYAMQAQLSHSQKMDAIGQLAGGVAHDFNNMLGGIIGAAEILEMHLPDDPQAAQFHKLIVDTANRAAELTQQLLSFARKRPLSSGPLEVNALVESTLLLLKRTIDRKITVKTQLADGPLTVTGDQSQLQSALLNLGINAWHAMPGGGTLTISTRTIELDEAFCNVNAFPIEPGPYVDVEIRDTGCGIPSEDLPHIFEPFFSKKGHGGGTGLGLAAVFGTVKQHRGTIWVYSEVDQGTCFHVMLPQSKGKQLESFEPEMVIPGSGTILVIDDEPIMLVTAEAILKSLGYTVLIAPDGEKGLETFKELHASIDMVMLDMVMPKMDGTSCFKAMRSFDPNAKIALVSGFTQEDSLVELKDAGLSGFIRKPYSKKALSALIANTIGDQNDGPAHSSS